MNAASPSFFNRQRPEWWIGALAFAVRFWFLQRLVESPFFEPIPGGSDRALYDRLAQGCAHGHIFPPGVFEYMPLYPCLLGIIYAVAGPNLYLVGLLGAILDAVTASLTVRIARALGAATSVACVMGALYALYPTAIIYCMMTMPNTLNAFLLTLFAGLCLKPPVVNACESDGTGSDGRRNLMRHQVRWFGMGLLAGVIALGFAGMLLIGFACLLYWTARNARASFILHPSSFILHPSSFFLFGLALPIFPVTLHNWRAEHRFVLVTAHGGFNFYMGNHENATGYPMQIGGFRGDAGSLLADARAEAEQIEGRKLKAAEFSEHWSRRAWKFIREHPFEELKLVGLKFLKFWNRTEYDDLRLLPMFRLTGLAFTSPLWPGFGWIAWFGLLGLFLARKCGILKIITLAGIAGIICFFITARYRMTFAPLLGVFGAFGLMEIGLWLRRTTADARRRHGAPGALPDKTCCNGTEGNDSMLQDLSASPRRTMRVIAAMVVSLVIVCLPLAQSDFRALDHYNTAAYLLARGETELAIRQNLLRNASSNGEAARRLESANALFVEAVRQAARGVAIAPDNADLHFVAGNALFRMEKDKEAVTAYQSAIRLKPSHASAHYNLAAVWMRLGQPARAANEAGLALRHDPQHPHAKALLREALEAKQGGK